MVCSFVGYAQQSASIRSKVIRTNTDTIVIDSLSIVPGSLIFLGDKKYEATIDYTRALIIWQNSTRDKKDSIEIVYKVYPINFDKAFYKRKRNEINSYDSKNTTTFYKETPTTNKESIFGLGGFNKAGSISRGLSIGNNQDPIVNSSLNLQLSGKLANGIEVVAAITDDNIPIQADGNTQQLQEFDRVFIQLSNDKNKVIVGDFDARNPEGYFLKYVKKGQGISYQFRDSLITVNNKKYGLEVGVAAAISRGKFARQLFPGIESNQGPYRLRGAENEFFIIVLSGTEKVFLDGQLLERGQDRDYIIDYNTAEIKFTPRRIISKDSRIIVEFQYSDKNYARSMLTGNVNCRSAKLNTRFNIYSEQDSKNQPVLQDLSEEQKLILANAGDNLNDALYLNADSVAYNINESLYAKRDTNVNGTIYSVFVYSTSVDSAFYRLGFTNVGIKKGNYVALDNIANGRVYQWVAPLNGELQGDYEPYSLLISPKKRQMAVAGIDYAFSNKTKVSFESAVTKNDINLFSKNDKSNDDGYAFRFQLDDKRNIGSDTLSGWSLVTQIQSEFTDINFSPIEIYRAAEFTRDWNTNTILSASNELLLFSNVSLLHKTDFKSTYSFKYYHRNEQYEGLMHLLNIGLIKNGWNIKADASQLNTIGKSFNSNYFKTRDIIQKKIKSWTPGLSYEQEKNQLQSVSSDSLLIGSFSWRTGEVFLIHGDTTKSPIKASVSRRYEDGLVNGGFKSATIADVAALTFSNIKNNHRISSTLNYRKLVILDTLVTTIKGDESFSGRVDYSTTAWKKAIQLNAYYEGGTGSEPRRIYSYIRVADGSGVYAWNDYNSDGIPQLNEFEVAEFKDQANYIRIFSTTNEYTKVVFNQLNFSININPANALKGKTLINRLVLLSSFKIDNRINADIFKVDYLIPVLTNYSIDQLIANQTSGKHTLFYNRLNPKGGMEFSYLHTGSKQFLSSGIESRTNEVFSTTIRKAIIKEINFLLAAEAGDKTSAAEFFLNRNYKIESIAFVPQLVYQPNSTYKILTAYRNSSKQNSLVEGNNERTIINDLSAEFRYSSIKKGVIGIKVNYLKISYNGDANTSLAYEMLEGLKAGENYKWQLSIQRNLGNSLQLSLNYDGRKPSGLSIIHTGGMQLRAFF
ncbi:MAG: hypothetical protein RL516_1543 [Bacteroidota bacterium]|jgi:hypothetical protein